MEVSIRRFFSGGGWGEKVSIEGCSGGVLYSGVPNHVPLRWVNV